MTNPTTVHPVRNCKGKTVCSRCGCEWGAVVSVSSWNYGGSHSACVVCGGTASGNYTPTTETQRFKAALYNAANAHGFHAVRSNDVAGEWRVVETETGNTVRTGSRHNMRRAADRMNVRTERVSA